MSSLRPLLLPLLAIALAAPAAPANPDKEPANADCKTHAAAAGAAALVGSGHPFFEVFFERGWPTKSDVKRLVLQDAQGAGEDTLIALMSSGAGLRLEDSAYIDAVRTAGLKRGGSPWARNSDVVKTKIEEFASIAGLTSTPKVDPIFFEFTVGRPKLAGAYDPSSWKSLAWVDAGQDTGKLTFDTLGASLYAQALYARQQLLGAEHSTGDSRRKEANFGSDPESAFLALVCLQLALAKVEEIRSRCLLVGGKLGTYRGLATYDQGGEKVWVPHKIDVKGKGASAKFEVDTSKEAMSSQLYDTSAMLLGCAELLKIVKWADTSLRGDDEASRRVRELFKNQRFDASGYSDVPFSPQSFELVTDVALLLVNNIQLLHLDVDRGVLRSRASKNPELERVQLLTAADAGMSIAALSEFLGEAAAIVSGFEKSNAALQARYNRKRKYASNCLRFQARWMRTIVAKHKVLYDRYNLATQDKLEDALTPASIGTLVSGFLAMNKVSGEDIAESDVQSSQELAVDLMLAAERRMWSGDMHLYVGRGAKAPQTVETWGQLSMLAALRDLALRTEDVRYLIRFGEVLGALKRAGFVASESARAGETGDDSDGDGIPGIAKAGLAPVLLPEIQVTKGD